MDVVGIGRNRCRGQEEIFEVSGAHDRAARAVELSPATWRRGGAFSYRVRGGDMHYTVHGRIRVLR